MRSMARRSRAAPDRWLRDHQPEERVTVKVRRAGEEMEFSFALGRQTDAIYQITEIPDATEKQRRIRNGILHGVTDPAQMIRTAIVAVFLSLYTLVLGPPLILYTLVTRSADLMYWVGVKGLVFITCVAGLRVRVEGLENIPAGVCMFAANHTSNADAAAIVGSDSPASCDFRQENPFLIFPSSALRSGWRNSFQWTAAIAKPRLASRQTRRSSTSRPVHRSWSIRREPAVPTAASALQERRLRHGHRSGRPDCPRGLFGRAPRDEEKFAGHSSGKSHGAIWKADRCRRLYRRTAGRSGKACSRCDRGPVARRSEAGKLSRI